MGNLTGAEPREVLNIHELSNPLTFKRIVYSVQMAAYHNIYRSGNKLVQTRPECYDCVHVMSLRDVEVLMLQHFIFVRPNGKVYGSTPPGFMRVVYNHLLDNVPSITTHADYPTHPCWQPGLSLRQIDAIIAMQRKARAKAKAW